MSEKKDIAKLDFNVNEALNSLDKVDKKLKTISETSEAYAKRIGNNLASSINSGMIVDTKSIESGLDKTAKLSKTKADQLSVQLTKNKAKEQSDINKIVAKGEQDRQTAAYKSALKQEEYNNRVLKSTKTLYDKVTEYAKTYIIYQGFSELRQEISETIDEMVQMEYQMVAIERVLNDSSLDIDLYRDKLIQMAYDYGNSFENVADITLRLAQAGFDAQESLMLTEKTLLALNTAELDATQATDDMVAIMAQWGLMTGTASEQAYEYGKIIDKINKVADNFPTKSEDILNALKKTSSAFNIAGASIDETIAMITAAEVASQRGGKVIGTALSNIVQQLKAEGKINIMESLGIDVYKDSTKQEFNSIIDIITQLSKKMQLLKESGKENSVEMQNLLEVFTVFRRNVGSSLLGEMAGEDSTYAEVLKTSINSVGYSLQENEKHMKTAKAAQAQFNAELLKLKTEVWDAGLEDMFRSMLMLGSDLANGISMLIDKFGLLPTTVGAATLAFTSLNKNMRAVTYDSESNSIQWNGFFKTIADGTKEIRKINAAFKTMKNGQVALTAVQGASIKGFAKNTLEVGKYGASLVAATAKTVMLQAATIALNAALSMGISLAISAIISAIDNWIHAEQKAIEKQQEALENAKDLAEEYENESETIKDLIEQYEELSKKASRTPEEETQIYEIQLKINELISNQKEQVDLVNGSYDEQLKKLKNIYNEKLKQEVQAKQNARKEAAANKMGISTSIGSGFDTGIFTGLTKSGIDLSDFYDEAESIEDLPGKIFGNLDWDEQYEYLNKWKEKLEEVGDTSSDTYDSISEYLKTLNEQQEEVNRTTEEYYNVLAKQKVNEMFTTDNIKSAEDFAKALKATEEFDFSGMEGFKEKIIAELINKFPEFNAETKLANGNLKFLDQTMNANLTSLQSYADQYAQLRYAQDEYNSTGQLTIETLQGLINNDLLQYLSIQNGQLQINAQSLLDNAEGVKIKAIEELKDAAAMDIQKVATGDLASISNIAKGAIASVGTNAENAGNQAQASTSKMNNFAASIQNVINASKDQLGSGVDPNTFQKQAAAIKDAYTSIAKTISSINIKSASYSPQKTSGSSGGSSSAAAAQAKREAEQAAEAAKKAEEEAYKARLEKFTDYIDEKERLEKRWVDKQKELELLSNEEYLYITQQRIERYKKYLEEVKKATWMNAEDRLKLEKEYSEKIEDLQVDYIGYLQDQLDDEISALEEANEEKIKLIEEEADARIAALQKVEDENDRIRAKEEYEKERQEHLNDISYWEQRTGREAQEALAEARKNLQELDDEWKKQQEDWTIEDQIAKIEAEREAEIKAIEDAQQKEIESIQAIYDAKVKLFAETGQIIYEGSVIQSQNLYNAYKQNFIDPISSDLANLNKAATTTATQAAAPTQQYETYTIKYGDTMSKIASNFGTTVEKIMEANPYVTNKNRIYAGKTLQIPKFHEGGIVGGNREAFALLKPNEVILKPEWADGINKLAKMAKSQENPVTNNSTVVEVKGDLVRIEANIKDKTDAEYLTRRIEKMLKDKFNIKK